MSIISFIEKLENALPNTLRAYSNPLLKRVKTIFSQEGGVARAQSMALWAFLVRIIGAGIAFGSQIIFARSMGEFEYGIFAFVWVLVILFGNLSCLGFHTTIVRYLPGYYTQNNFAQIRGLNSAARYSAITIAVCILIIGQIFLAYWGEVVADYYLVPVITALFILPIIALGDILDATAQANSWALSSMNPTYIIRPTLIIICMLTAFAFDAPATATTAMQAALVATFLTTAGQLVYLQSKLNKTFNRGGKEYEYKRWLNFALAAFLIDSIGFLMTNADVVIVGLYLPPDQVAVYFVAAKTIILMQFVFFAVKAAAGPRFAALISENDLVGLDSFAKQMARWTFFPSLIIGMTLLLFGPFLLSLFGQAFTDGYSLMAILFLGFTIKATIGPGESLLVMAGQQRLCVMLYIVSFSTNIILNMIFIPLYGLEGAALAVICSMFVETILLFIVVRMKLGITLSAFSFSRKRI